MIHHHAGIFQTDDGQEHADAGANAQL